MIDTVLATESTLTNRYQTTIPDAVRKALGLKKREKICYTINSDGQVILSRAEQQASDPALAPFLTLLANDIQQNPDRLTVLAPGLVSYLQALVQDIEVDLDTVLDDDDE